MKRIYFLFLAILIPLLVILSLYKAYLSYNEVQTFSRKTDLVNILAKTSKIESLTAKEKYYSMLYLDVNGVNYMDQLEASRKRAKSFLDEFVKSVSAIPGSEKYENALKNYSTKLNTLRLSVDKLEPEAIKNLLDIKRIDFASGLHDLIYNDTKGFNDYSLTDSLSEQLNNLDYKLSLSNERTLLGHFAITHSKLNKYYISLWESILEGIGDKHARGNGNASVGYGIEAKLKPVRGDVIEHSLDTKYSYQVSDVNTIFENCTEELNKIENNMLQKIRYGLENAKSNSNTQMTQFLLVAGLLMLVTLLLLRYYRIKKKEELAIEESLKEIVSDLDEEQRLELEKITKKGNRSEAYRFLSRTALDARAAEERALQAEKAKDLFLANMSHEIRTPLNGILGFTQLMMGTPLTAEQKEFMSVISGSSENLLKIVNDILDLSKIRADKMDLERIPFSILQQMEKAIEPLAARALEKKIEYSTFIDPLLPKVVGDPTKLSQVMTNLIGNAVKFTGEGGTVDVDVRKVTDNENNVIVRFSVKDSGIGISEEQIKKIFEPFSQADISTTREYGGTGLGLTITKDIITHMGGALDVVSVEGQGSEFFFELGFENAGSDEKIENRLKDKQFVYCRPSMTPLKQMERNLEFYIRASGGKYKVVDSDGLKDVGDDDIVILDYSNEMTRSKIEELLQGDRRVILISTPDLKHETDSLADRIERVIYRPLTASKIIRAYESMHSSSKENVVVAQEDLNASLKGLRVLVAEDNPINQKLIVKILEDMGTIPTLASNGKEACNMRSEKDFDIIFMDVQMPVMGGIEATREIIKMEKYEGLDHTPIVALTANALQGDREKYLKEGMDDYISKPIKIEQVRSVISKYCTANRKQQVEKKVTDADIDTETKKSSLDHAESSSHKEIPGEKNDSNKNILLYCGDKLIQSIHKHVVEEAGYQMFSAENESDLFKLFDDRKYEYVLIDSKILPKDNDQLVDIIRDNGSTPLVYSASTSGQVGQNSGYYSAISELRKVLAT